LTGAEETVEEAVVDSEVEVVEVKVVVEDADEVLDTAADDAGGAAATAMGITDAFEPAEFWYQGMENASAMDSIFQPA
jgi:hypothetical protein